MYVTTAGCLFNCISQNITKKQNCSVKLNEAEAGILKRTT
jgi:hypothetical protein